MISSEYSSNLLLIIFGFGLMQLVACNNITSDDGNNSNGNSEWLIPGNEVIDGGPGKDGIPSVDAPKFSTIDEADYIQEERLVLGVKINDEVRLYPHQILDWHEIVNDKIGDQYFSLTYCPLTGTGITYNRVINNEVNEFGVSGLLFRNNLIMYDRNTDSRWSQMQMRAVNGELIGKNGNFIQTVEATWETWKNLYPGAKVMTTETGFSRDYEAFTYGRNYLTDHDLFIFQPKRSDERLENKTIVHAVMPQTFEVESTVMRIYPIKDMSGQIQVIQEQFDEMDLVIAGSSELRFGVSFSRTTQDGATLTFEPVQEELPVIMEDNEGNRWTIFGEAVNGPRAGERLTPTTSYNGYWFAFANFYPESCIYPETEC